MGSVNSMAMRKERERCRCDESSPNNFGIADPGHGELCSRASILTLLRLLAPARHEHWLAAGAGEGNMSLELAGRVRSLVCIDPSAASLGELAVRGANCHLTNIRTTCAELYDNPLASGQFDGILCSGMLQWMPTVAMRRRCLDELYRLLKPGGRCLVSVLHRHAGGGGRRVRNHNGVQPEELAELMGAAGFVDLNKRGLELLPQGFSRHLPPSLAFLEAWCTRCPGSVRWGNWLLAIGTRPARS